MPNDYRTILAVCATDREYNSINATLAHRLGGHIVEHNGDMMWHCECDLATSPFRVIVKPLAMYNPNAAAELARVLDLLHRSSMQPDAVLLAACAGGLKNDVQKGDIVIPQKVYYYEAGKEKDYDPPEGNRRTEFEIRPELLELSDDIKDAILKIDGKKENWAKFALGSHVNANFSVHRDVEIASGEKVLASNGGKHYKSVKKDYRRASVVDMETYGVMRTCKKFKLEQKLVVVRGISDMCGDKNALDPKDMTEQRIDISGLSESYINSIDELEGSFEDLKDEDRQRVVVSRALCFGLAASLSLNEIVKL